MRRFMPAAPPPAVSAGVRRGAPGRALVLRRQAGQQLALPSIPAASVDAGLGPNAGGPAPGAGQSYEQLGDYLGFSLGGLLKTVKKAVVDTGHTVGKVVTSKPFQAIEGAALAATGVGIPAAAGIMALSKGVGTAIKPGGNLKGVVTATAQGAAEGVASSLAGKAIQKLAPAVTSKARSIANKVLPGTPFKTLSDNTQAVAGDVGSAIVSNPGLDALATGGLATLAASGPQLIPSNAGGVPGYNPTGIDTPIFAAPMPPASGAKRRVKSNTPPKIGQAKSVLKAGQQANDAADATAGKIDALSQKLDAVSAAAAAAAAAGSPSSALSQAAQAIQSQISGLQNIAGGASADLRSAGAIAEGATAGAVGGGALSSLSDFISNNKPLVIGSVVGLGVLAAIALGRKHGGSSGSRRAA